MTDYTRIKGDKFEDERGTLRFVNSFDMGKIVRFYEIAPKNNTIIRAWQGHQHERKWFYCLSGSFVINLIKIDKFDNPSTELIPERIEIHAETPEVLEIPGGYATGIKAMDENSRLQVFSDFGLEASGEDDYRFPVNTWEATW